MPGERSVIENREISRHPAVGEAENLRFAILAPRFDEVWNQTIVEQRMKLALVVEHEAFVGRRNDARDVARSRVGQDGDARRKCLVRRVAEALLGEKTTSERDRSSHDVGLRSFGESAVLDDVH